MEKQVQKKENEFDRIKRYSGGACYPASAFRRRTGMTRKSPFASWGSWRQTAGSAGGRLSVVQNVVREYSPGDLSSGKESWTRCVTLLWETEATGVICDDELRPAQLNNLQQELDCKVM